MLLSFGEREVTLRIELDAFDGNFGWVESYDFTMRGADASYRLDWQKSRGATQILADSWDINKEHAFKTFDMHGGEPRCLKKFKGGGWWYSSTCNAASGLYMNGDYTDKGIYVRAFKVIALQRSRMMFRTKDIVRACVNPCRNGGACVHVPETRGHRCVCTLQFCGAECDLANPCQNGGSCEYDTSKSTTCKCSAAFCGPICEMKNTCENGGTCEYDDMTKSAACRCPAKFLGPKCQHAETTTSTTTPTIPKTPTTPTAPTAPTTPMAPRTPYALASEAGPKSSGISMPAIGGTLLPVVVIVLVVAAVVIYLERRRGNERYRANNPYPEVGPIARNI